MSNVVGIPYRNREDFKKVCKLVISVYRDILSEEKGKTNQVDHSQPERYQEFFNQSSGKP